MQRKHLKYYLFLGIWLSGFYTLAQTQVDRTWTLEECLAYAKENNITINSLRLDSATSEQNLTVARAAVLPNLTGSASQGLNHYNATTSPILGSTGSVSLNSSVTLYNGGYLRNDIKQKDLLVKSSNLAIREQENSISLQIVQAYLNILLDKETIIYAEDLVTTSQAQVNQMEQQFKVGSVAKKDLIQLQAQLANDQYTLTNAQNAERQDKLTLKQLLQLPLENNFDVAKPDSIFTAALLPSLNEVVDVAMETRPEVQNSVLNIKVAQLDLKKTLAGYLPTISLSGSLGTAYGNTYTEGFRQLNNNGFQQIGITASFPIFNRKVNRTNEAKAKINIQQAELSLKNTKTLLSQAIEQAYINALNSNGRFDAAVQQLTYNREAFRISGEELRVGSSNTVDYVQQKNLYAQSLQSYTQAKYNTLLAVKIYEFYQGDELTLK